MMKGWNLKDLFTFFEEPSTCQMSDIVISFIQGLESEFSEEQIVTFVSSTLFRLCIHGLL